MDRSPGETGSQDNDMDDLESDDDLDGTMASDGERIIYPWMKKIHVAGVGKSDETCERNARRHFAIFFFLLHSEHHPLSPHYSNLSRGCCCLRRSQKEGEKISISSRIMSEHALCRRKSACSFQYVVVGSVGQHFSHSGMSRITADLREYPRI